MFHATTQRRDVLNPESFYSKAFRCVVAPLRESSLAWFLLNITLLRSEITNYFLLLNCLNRAV